MNTERNILLDKLEAFIRKYYKNQLIKGGLWVLAGIATAFTLASLLEYFGHFNKEVRTGLFFAFAIFSAAITGFYIIVPLLRLYKLGKRLNYDQAAVIVGKHFEEVGDKLLNTLQLGKDAGNNLLLQAAIEQKTAQLSPVPFQQAVNFKANIRYIKYAGLPILGLLILLIVAPGFKESTGRLVNYSEHYERKAPFDFILKNQNLECLQHQDVEIKLETKGSVVPADAYIHIDGNDFKMRKDENGEFSYVLKRLSDNKNFHFEASGFSSREYEMQVIPKPTLIEFETFLDYPAYTGLADEQLKNTADVTLPVGTKIAWKMNVRNADSLTFFPQLSGGKAKRENKNFEFSHRAMQSGKYLIKTSNSRVKNGDSLYYSIQVIPDEYPVIEIDEKPDSLRSKLIYMIGKVADDYGFSKLEFKYKFVSSDDKSKIGKSGSAKIGVDSRARTQTFYHIFDLAEIGVTSSDKVEYYFEIWDNDGVHGSKSTKSKTEVFEAPSIDEINKQTQQKTDEIKSDISERKSDLKDLEKDILELEKKLTEKKTLTWEEKKKIEELLKKHEELQKNLENIVEQNKKNNTREEEFKPIDQEIKDKQEEIEKLFNEVMNDEIKDLMDKIQELMDKNQKDQLQNQLDKLKLNDKEVDKQLDRMLEQLKHLQLEKKVNETVEKFEKLSEEQEKLSEQSEEGKKNSEELKKEQEKLNDKFEDLKKDLKDIDKKNQDLEKPMNLKMEDLKPKSDEVDKQQDEGTQNLGNNKQKKASQNQKKAADEMKEEGEKLDLQMQQAQKEQQAEDYNTLREILDNLIQVSKDQEDLMQSFKQIRGYNPKYVELGQEQKKIRDDTRMIEDSLLALSKRVKQVEFFINKEIGLVNDHMNKAMSQLGERNTGQVINHQQYVMTSLNNLALMLSESLKQMQQQMKSSPGSGSCQNPGGQGKEGSSQPMKNMRQMQEELKKMMEGMQDGEGGQKPGSKQFAEAAAKQAAIRKMLQDLQKQLEKEGKSGKLGDLGKTAEMMDDIEKDLYNKRMNPDLIKRQEEILTRLLEHEKAEKEQEKDNKRQSNEGKDKEKRLPPNIEEYLKQKEKEQELLKTLPPDLTPYYKEKVREYFREIGS
ncbi:MAG: DUF4175 family protein [Bacteroidetes bacterium]|nr:DUF4175 family protein [Bacteroidota bacterium]